MKTSEIIANNQNETKEKIQNEIREKMYFLESYESKTFELSQLPLESVFNEYGLEIRSLSFRLVKNEDLSFSLSVSMTVVPLSKTKVKFYTHTGYDSRGDGKNRKQLVNQSEKLTEFIKSKIKTINNVQVNYFCFEVENKEDTNSILINFWL